jgi:competence protein ComEA
VADAVEAAGGAAAGADTDSVNLALPISDGEQIFIPTQPGLLSPQPSHCVAEVRGRADISRSTPTAETPGPRLVNINTAGPEELATLPGIGPALAARIIQYRTASGPFLSPRDLICVSGIGEAKLEAVLPLVTVK